MRAAYATRSWIVTPRRLAAVVAKPAVTAVAIKARAKMLRKHGAGRVSLVITDWEISMPFAKSLPAASSSSRIRALRLIDQHIASGRTHGSDDKFETSLPRAPEQGTSPGALSRLKAEAVALVAHAGSAVPNAPIAILSWLIAEFCAGCAAYAQAMYPIVPPEDDVDRGDNVSTAASRLGNRPRTRTVLTLVRATAERGFDGDGVVPLRAGSEPNGCSRCRTELLPQPESARTGLAGRCDSFSVAAIALWSKARAIHRRHRAVMELETLDDRTLHDIRICRRDIDAALRHESWRE